MNTPSSGELPLADDLNAALTAIHCLGVLQGIAGDRLDSNQAEYLVGSIFESCRRLSARGAQA